MNLGQDWTTQSIQHCCLRFLAISVGNSTFNVSRAASMPPAVSVSRRGTWLSVIIIIILNLKPFLLVDYWSPQLCCCGSDRDGENICRKGQANGRVSSGKAVPVRAPTWSLPLVVLIAVQQLPLPGHDLPFLLSRRLFL